MKRIISMILALVLVIGLLPVSAFAATLAITQQPVSVTVAEGETAKVTVVATGDGLSYRWYYKNPGASGYTYTSSFKGNTYSVTMNAERNGRQVLCRVYDKYGNSVQSNTVKLSMKTTVKITQQPVSVTVAEGETAKVTVGAVGDGLSYRWYYKNPGASGYTYTSSFKGNTYSVPMTAERNGRQVLCRVYDQYGNSVQSNTVKLSMKETQNTVKITQQPQNVTVSSGEIAKVTVTASGDGLTYQWYLKNPGKTTFSKSSIVKNYYSVTMTDAVNGRQVYCVVTDKNGASVKSNTVTLSMDNTLKITQEPVSVRVAEGEKATVTVKATGDGLTYKWYYKDAGTTEYKYTATFTGNSYSIIMNEARNGRFVYCNISDKYGNTIKSKTVALRMEEGFRITTQPKSYTELDIESTTTYHVAAAGGKEPYSYQWQYAEIDDAELGADGKYVYSWSEYEDIPAPSSDNWSGETTDTFTWVHGSYDYTLDAIKLRCRVTDADGNTVYSKDATHQLRFQIWQDPDIWYYHVYYYHVVDSDVCGGIYPYTYTWQYTNDSLGGTYKTVTPDLEWVYLYSSYTPEESVALSQLCLDTDDTAMFAREHYRFRYIVTDADGKKLTSESVGFKLMIVDEPENVESFDGDQVSFHAEAAGGKGPYTYQWQYICDGQEYKNLTDSYTWLSGGTTDTLTVNVSENHFRYHNVYRCIVTDAEGNQVTTKEVCAYKPLTITVQPADVIASVGDEARFTVETEGGCGKLSYTWYYNGSSYTGWVANDSNYSNYYTQTLTVTSVNERDLSREIYVTVKDQEGNKVTSDKVRIYAPLVVKTQPEDAYANAGEWITFTAEAKYGKEPYTYQWQYISEVHPDPRPFDSDSNGIWHSGSTTDTLSIEVYKSDIVDKWQYRCIITDANGQSVTTDYASLYQGLHILTQPKNTTGQHGGSAFFSVEVAGGSGDYSYEWLYSYNTENYYPFDELTTGYQTDTVKINKIYPSHYDSYSYKCRVTDNVTKQVVESQVVYLRRPLRITQQPQSQTGKAGDTLTFTVAVSDGIAPYSYKWYSKAQSGQWIESTTNAPNYKFEVNVITAMQTYSFYCVITDADGKQVTTNTVTFTPA